MRRYEAVDYNDPLSLLLAAEGEDDDVDERQSFFEAGTHRRATSEPERTESDMMGASPVELAAQDWLH